ncbi:tyrosine-type recombinase/integrase [Candidatus Poribacteria bacterium]
MLYKSRTVSLTPVLYEMLQKIWRNRIGSAVRSEYVFTYKEAKIRGGIDTTLRKVVKKAGLTDITLHTFRHTFAFQLALAGVPLRDIQELMGHQSFQTTLQYAHLSEEHVKKRVLQLPFAGNFAGLGHKLCT